MYYSRTRTAAVIIAISLLPLFGFPQEPIPVTKLIGTINFDGIPDDTVWLQVPELPLVMHSPVFGNEPTEKSIIRMAYDNEYLYVSGILHYKEINDMRAIGRKRDYSSMSTDWFGVILSTRNEVKVKSSGIFTSKSFSCCFHLIFFL